jgi:hypothetical protein
MRQVFTNSYVRRPDTIQNGGIEFIITLLETKAHVVDEYFNPNEHVRFFSDEEGKLPTFNIPTPPVGAWRWSLKTPDGVTHIALIGQGDGESIEISDWFALSGEVITPEPVEESFLTYLYDVVTEAPEHQILMVGPNNRVVTSDEARGYFMQKTSVDAGDTITIPSGHQMSVYGAFDISEDSDVVVEGELVVKANEDATWVEEAPLDDTQYVRKNGAWVHEKPKVIFANSSELTLLPEDSGATVINLTSSPVNVTLPTEGLPCVFDFGIPTDGVATGNFYPHFKIVDEPSTLRRNVLRGSGQIVKFNQSLENTDYTCNVSDSWKEAVAFWDSRPSADDTLGWISVCWSTELMLFVAVANGGTGNRVMTSPDGIVWTSRSSANDTFSWYSVCWSPELMLFVAVATAGTGNRVMTSPDGIVWTSRASANDTLGWISVCWSQELLLFVAVAYNVTGNRVMTSPDGIVWTSRSSANDTFSWYSVCWSPELMLFVAVAYNGTGNRVMTSPDGIVWTSRASANETFAWSSVCWSPELMLFVAVAQSGTGNRVMTSPDGIVWTSRASSYDMMGWISVCWSPELMLFAAVATSQFANRVMTSPDGIVWTGRASANDTFNWQSVYWSPELRLFVAVANGGVGNRVMTSPNGFVWTSRASANDTLGWQSVCWSPELLLFVAVASSQTGKRVMTCLT